MRTLKTICLTLSLMLGVQLLSAQENYILHTVLKGQGLYSISRMYGVTEQEIIALNPGSEDVIKAGEQLRIPVKSSGKETADGKAEARDGYIAHLVQPGETMYRLTVIYGVSGMDIRAANPKLSSDGLKAGEIVYIPLKKEAEAAPSEATKEESSSRKFDVKQIVRTIKGDDAEEDDGSIRVGSYKVKSAFDPDKKAENDARKAEKKAAAEAQKAAEREEAAQRAQEKERLAAERAAEREREAAQKEADKAKAKADEEAARKAKADEEAARKAKAEEEKTVSLEQLTKKAEEPKRSAVQCKTEHEVRLLETVYSLARRYGITQEELLAANPEVAARGLKRGQVVCIPYSAAELAAMNADESDQTDLSDVVLTDETSEHAEGIHTPWNGINVAVILPFQLTTTATNADKAKMVEYYEGLLISVDSLKKNGVSINLYAYDSGSANTSISDILAKEEMSSMDIIFGPVHQKHIDEAAAFAADHNIPLVLPFARDVKQLKSNPMIYQVNVEQDDLDAEGLEHFFTAFPKPNVLFFETKGGKTDPFAKKLMTELDARNYDYSKLVADTTSFVGDLMTHLDESADNILMMASTDKENKALSTMMPVFQLMARDSLAVGSLHLFGYPQYQVYAVSHMEQCQEVDTWFYSSFYTNNLLPEAVDFHRLFRRTYSRDLTNRYPKYGILGFDTGWYFLNAISRHLSQPASVTLSDLSRYDCPTIQTGFRFERVSEVGGWANRKAYLIHIGRDGRVRRIDYD